MAAMMVVAKVIRKETRLFLSYLGVDYEVFCMDDEFDVDEFKELMTTIQVEGFNPKYFSK